MYGKDSENRMIVFADTRGMESLSRSTVYMLMGHATALGIIALTLVQIFTNEWADIHAQMRMTQVNAALGGENALFKGTG